MVGLRRAGQVAILQVLGFLAEKKKRCHLDTPKKYRGHDELPTQIMPYYGQITQNYHNSPNFWVT